MNFIDPGGPFGTFQQIQDEEIVDYSVNNSKVPQTSGILSRMTPTRPDSTLSFNDLSTSTSVSLSPQIRRTEYNSNVAASKVLDSPSIFFDNINGGLVSSEADPYEVNILGIPESGARSRTETQVKLILRVLPRANVSPIKWLSLPYHQLSSAQRSKSHEEEYITQDGSDTLYVRTRLLKSDSEETVYACYSCILRERKRCFRKRTRGIEQDDFSEELVHIDNAEKETEQDRERIIVFASQTDKLQVMRGDVMMPVRLTCYCRHHDERVGFRVKIELLDSHHRLVGATCSPPILITDDHKRQTRQVKTIEPSSSYTSPLVVVPFEPFSISFGGGLLQQVLKLVPAEGPMHGGIEVTVLGHNLSAESVLMFGSLPATVVNAISSSTIIVRLPPSHVAGIVPVTIPGQNSTISRPDEFVFFNYKNDLDRAMMELALQLIGMKMTGRVDDARDIALRIINEFSPNAATTSGGGGGRGFEGSNLSVANSLQATNNQATSSGPDRLEQVLITCLAAAENTGGILFSQEDVLKFRTGSGQTLLHLSALARYDHLFEYLGGIGDGSLLAAVDSNGFTPSDLYYLAGRQDFLETLGLDDSDHEENVTAKLDLLSRYRLIQARAQERRNSQFPTSFWPFLLDGLTKICRRPSRMRNHMNRLRNAAWRKLTSEANVKEYYLTTFGTKNLALTAGSRLYQNYKNSMPFQSRSRDLMLNYFWIPILMATLLVWYFDLGSNVMSAVAAWAIVPEPPVLV